ncbi:hypothetical protein SK571_40085 [Lentzea sp. BCCO 10_0798]|uniref:Uncharacterized protein n=1 Tax=Lentzea kristufekii TaxID=3095430 RepID=A0ABU4U4X0_9PSEU|nr:hypothetical protein [Lentzea sp. BCCO 10_0798]MDX8055613.1 hypothetical protein [Lentzea sp. BCCO 10_0798]
MAHIVGIHGIWNNRSARAQMHEEWLAAITRGLKNVRSAHTDTLTFESAFYGHEYNDGKASDDPHYTEADLDEGFETEFAEAMAATLPDETDGHKGGRDALIRLVNCDLAEGVMSRLVGFIKQVRRYLEDDEFRRLVHAEVSNAMETRPQVVIGHSLGSVIAYDWLQRNRPDEPPALITIGSPLGYETIRKQLHQPMDRSRWPDGARTWTNIAAGLDPVALVKDLAPLFHPDIEDLPCTNRLPNPHSALQYLDNVWTSKRIDKALS